MIDNMFLPKSVQVSHLYSNNIETDFTNVVQTGPVLHRQIIKPTDKINDKYTVHSIDTKRTSLS